MADKLVDRLIIGKLLNRQAIYTGLKKEEAEAEAEAEEDVDVDINRLKDKQKERNGTRLDQYLFTARSFWCHVLSGAQRAVGSFYYAQPSLGANNEPVRQVTVEYAK